MMVNGNGGINAFGLILESLFGISGKKVIVLIDEYNTNVIDKFLSMKNSKE